MVRRKRPEPTKMLTELELAIMTSVWRREAATVADVKSDLQASRGLAHTTVATMLKVLEGKGVVVASKEGRGLVYEPVLTKAEYETRALDHVVARVFDEDPLALVRRLLGEGKLDETALDELRRMLAEKA